KGLRDALLAIVQGGDDDSGVWPIEKVLDMGDRAAGVTVLADLYKSMKDQAVEPDLEGLWTRLGVRRQGRTVQFDDGAPLAAVRRSITGSDSIKSSSLTREPSADGRPRRVNAGVGRARS